MANGKKEVDILLVEDDPGDVELIKEGLAESKVLIKFNAVDDGIKALKYLKRESPYNNAVSPDLILLDLNLPKKNGREVLKEIKGDDTLKSIPVIILTTSESDVDILKCYELGANSYITKPVTFEGFKRAVVAIEEFWFAVVKLPPKKKL